MTTEQKIVRARTTLMLDFPWFGSLVLKLSVEPTRDGKASNGQDIPTMATDGNGLVYNPVFVDKLSEQELIGVLAHEVLHCALLHPYRRGGREAVRANIAMDLAINPIVLDSGLKLPGVGRTVAEMQAGASGYLLDPKFAGMGFETIYNMLPVDLSPQMAQAGGMGGCNDSPNGKGKGKGDGEGNQDGEGEGDGAGSAENAMSEADWQIAAKQAEMVASKAGKMPAGVAREIKNVRETQTDWRTLLRRFVTATYRHDSTWARPSRRGMAMGYTLPGVLKENTGEIVVAIDTSDSVTSAMLEQFRGEIQAIKDETRPERLHVVYCDAVVNGHAEFTPDMEVEVKMCGGGGTAFQPVFDWIRDKGIDPKCLVYLTDLDSYDRPTEPQYPVMWVTPDWVSKVWGWGEVVRIKC